MVDSVVTKQELIDAQKDAQSLEDVINGPADTRVKPRIGPEMWTLATINSLVQQGQIKISDLSEAIQTALAAGAGSAGWTANLVADGNQTQKEINLYGGKKYDMPVGGYPLNARIMLDNGDIVKSTEPNNTIDPNIDMTGWINPDEQERNRNNDLINARDWGVLPTNSPEVNSANWFALNNAFPERGALDIFVPVGNYKFSEGFFISRPHCIQGVGSGENCKTIFNFAGATPVGTATYKAGVFVAHSGTWDDAEYGIINKPQGQIVTAGTGAVLENIAVINSSEHGIIKNAPCNFFGVAAMRNAKHGILTAANVSPTMIVYGGQIAGVANQGANVQCASLFNGKSGFAEFGSDANVINNDTCLAAYNSEFGFYGGNLLGSVHTSCQAHANTLGDYVMQGGLHDNSGLQQTPANNLYNGCYAEGQRDSTYSVNGRSLVINALGGKPLSDTVNYLSPSIVGLIAGTFSAATSGQHIYDGKGGAFTKVSLDGIKIGSDAVKTAAFDIHSSVLGRIVMGVNGGGGIIFFLEDFNTTLKVNRPLFANGLTMGTYHYQTVGTEAPTTGAWDKGNMVWNETPAAGGKIGWVCVAGGSPGVWKSFGSIDP